MRKRLLCNIFVLVLLMVTFVFSTGCKKFALDNSDLQVVLITGSGSYDSATNTTMIKVLARIKIMQPAIGKDYLYITPYIWSFSFYESEDQESAINFISNDTYKELLGDKVITEFTSQAIDYVTISLETVIPVSGDLFHDKNPASVQLAVVLADNKNNYYTLESENYSFQFTRQ